MYPSSLRYATPEIAHLQHGLVFVVLVGGGEAE